MNISLLKICKTIKNC